MTFNPSRFASAALVGVALSTSAYVSVVQAQEATASGEVRRVDVAAGKITLKHGSIDALQLPGMTLVYNIDPALLEGIQPGDKVRFTAKRENEQYVVTKIQK
ncbi:MAG TPA: copper-binding protein [Paenalcaligenes sp.]|nr:copper-binding protein [Paenalcaligenes sp.]